MMKKIVLLLEAVQIKNKHGKRYSKIPNSLVILVELFPVM
jgi:hypothetical protein